MSDQRPEDVIERLQTWATGTYRAETSRFPFGVYANPTELREDILSLLAELRRVSEREARLREALEEIDETARDIDIPERVACRRISRLARAALAVGAEEESERLTENEEQALIQGEDDLLSGRIRPYHPRTRRPSSGEESEPGSAAVPAVTDASGETGCGSRAEHSPGASPGSLSSPGAEETPPLDPLESARINLLRGDERGSPVVEET